MTSPNVDLSKLLKINDDFYIFQDQDALLGKGAFGQVYKGYSKSRNKMIAVKHIEVSEDYQREIQTLKILSTLVHPNIMGFYGYQHRQNDVYMFVQFCPNGDLTGTIKKGLTQLQVLKYFRQMVEGMCYMNAKSKMHRDLKPDNILIGTQKDLKISDFGLARETDNIMITGKKGTPIYAGPQVYLSDDEKYTEKCDVWGGGMILYEMLVGEMLFKHVKTYAELKFQWALYQKGEKRVQYNPNLHPLWEYFTNIMLTFDPKKRPTYHQVLTILKKTYSKMEKEISNKTMVKSTNPKLAKVQNYLNFETQKFGVLRNILQKYNQKQLQIKEEVNYIVIFLCIAKYLTHMKKLIRDLKHKNIDIPDCDEDLVEDETKDYEIVLCMDKYRNIIDTSYTYYNNKLKSSIVDKIISVHATKHQNDAFFASIKETFNFAKDIKQGMFDVEDGYTQKLRQIASSKYFLYDDKSLAKWGVQELVWYSWALIGASLDKIFPIEKYSNQNYVKNYLSKDTDSANKLLVKIKQLKAFLK